MAANPWAGFSGQCVGWVRTVLPWVPGGPASAYQYANGTLTNVGATQVAPSSAQVGDVVVWPQGVGGASYSDGHIAVVSQVLSNGVQVSQANWGENGAPSTMVIPMQTLSSLDVYAPPANQQASSASRAALSGLGLGTSGTLGNGNGGTPVNDVFQGGTYQSLGQATQDTGTLGSKLPGDLVSWVGQSTLRYRIMFDLLTAAMVSAGLMILFRRDAEHVISLVKP